MIREFNKNRERSKIIHDINDLMKAEKGSLWKESPIAPKSVGRDGGSPGYVVATGSQNPKTAYVVFAINDYSGYQDSEDTGIFLPEEHSLTFPLIEVTDGTEIIIGNKVPTND